MYRFNGSQQKKTKSVITKNGIKIEEVVFVSLMKRKARLLKKTSAATLTTD